MSLSDNSDRSPAAPITHSAPQPSLTGADIHQLPRSAKASHGGLCYHVMLVGTWVVFQDLPAKFDHIPGHSADDVYDAVRQLSVEVRDTIDHGVAIDLRVSPQTLLELIETYRLTAAERVVIALTEAAETMWQEQAVCAQADPEIFFPEKGGATAGAKALCRSCPVRPDCLDYALKNDERFGVWGGLSERERRKLTRTSRRNAAAVATPQSLSARRVG